VQLSTTVVNAGGNATPTPENLSHLSHFPAICHRQRTNFSIIPETVEKRLLIPRE
jgi:hypothetical protein